jgi:methanethiol S-methyltransferase
MILAERDLLIPLAWALWCAFHSFLITPGVTAYAQKKLGGRFRFYRLIFNAVSFLTLIPVFWYSWTDRQAPLFRWTGPWLILQVGLVGISLFLLAAGGRHYSLSRFLGFEQIRTGRTGQTLSDQGSLDLSGIHRVTRHPWYLGGFLIIWARDITWAILLSNIVMDAYFVVGALLEEKKLRTVFGRQYQDYQKQVSLLFPCRWLKAKLGLFS